MLILGNQIFYLVKILCELVSLKSKTVNFLRKGLILIQNLNQPIFILNGCRIHSIYLLRMGPNKLRVVGECISLRLCVI